MPDEEGYLLPGEPSGASLRWHSRDEEGYLEAGDLGGGGYAAMEGDLGHKLRPLAGFGRDFEEPEEDEIWEGVVFTPEKNSFQTTPGAVLYHPDFSKWNDVTGWN